MPAQVKPMVFLQEVKTELLRVSWPTKEQTIRLTSVVIGVSFVLGFFLGGVDFVLTKIMETVIR